MAIKTDLHDEIVRAAAELFIKQSFAATSIKQIAQAAHCTTAALYYYFEDGKAGILRQVIDQVMPDLSSYLSQLINIDSLQELVLRFGLLMAQVGEDMFKRTRWLMVEFPNLAEEERSRLHGLLLEFHKQLADRIEPFARDRRQAELIAWVLYTSLFGYGQLFVTLELESVQDSPMEDFVVVLAEMISKLNQ